MMVNGNKILQKLEEWFDQGSGACPVHSADGGEFIIYKGIKITKHHSGGFTAQDVRYSNMYSPVSGSNLSLFCKHGFIKGVDTMSNKRDLKRIQQYKKRAEICYQHIKKFKKLLTVDKKFNEKRIRNTRKRIDESIDMIFFYQTRVQQFNNKYKS